MTVEELIKQLSKLNPKAMVVLQSDSEGNGYSPLAGSEAAKYIAENTYSGFVPHSDDIASGEHKGKKHTLFIPGDDNEMNKKKRAQFFFKSGFWTEAEIANDATQPISLARLVGRKFSARASKVREKDDKKWY